MKVARIVLSLGFLLVLTGGALAQKVRVDWDKTASFTGFKTYAWGESTRATNPLMDQRIVEGLEAQLAAKGLRKVDAEDNPDLVVTYHVATEIETQFNTMNTGVWGPGWGYGWRGGMGMGMGMGMGPGMATTTGKFHIPDNSSLNFCSSSLMVGVLYPTPKRRNQPS